MTAIGRLGKVRLLAPRALRTSSDKKHLTFSVWKAEVTLSACFSGRYVRRQGKTQVEREVVCVCSCMCVSLADIKWQRKSIHHSWHEDDCMGHNRHWRWNRFLAPRALSVCVCMGYVRLNANWSCPASCGHMNTFNWPVSDGQSAAEMPLSCLADTNVSALQSVPPSGSIQMS